MAMMKIKRIAPPETVIASTGMDSSLGCSGLWFWLLRIEVLLGIDVKTVVMFRGGV